MGSITLTDENYEVPFSFSLLSYEEAVVLARDTGKIPGDAGPLLETVVEMLDELGRPDSFYDCIQIAGTNGKTSTSRFSSAILMGEGLKASLYTSPELVHMEERMEVMGTPVSRELFAFGVSAAAEAGRRVNERRAAAGLPRYTITPFDLLTVAALAVFALERVDVAVLEVGLGGRWDATSATDPVAVAITGIGLDHTHILGDTLAKIAAEKAAVIKPGRKVVLGEGVHEASVRAVMDARCAKCRVEPVLSNHETIAVPAALGERVEFSCATPRSRYRCSMVKPAYQPQNAACAITLCEAYLGRKLNREALERSFASCPTPGRFDVLREEPLLLVDACHNPQSCENFVSALDEISTDVAHRPTLLIAALADKDVTGIVRVLAPAFPSFAVTQTASERAMPAWDLAGILRAELERAGRSDASIEVFDTVARAVDEFAAAGRPLVCAGTITLAGEVAGHVRG